MDPSLRSLIEQAEFKESFRGYDRAQVDDTLEQLASRAGRLESEAAEATRRLQDAETRIRAEADAEVEARVQAKLGAAGTAPVRNEQEDAEEVRLTLVMAQRTADAAIAEARVKAGELLDAARTEALRTTADVRSEVTQERQEGRKRLAGEVKDLEDVRGVLQGDIDTLNRHVKAEREQLSKAIDRLKALLEDPTAFRTATPPAPTPVVIPDPPADLATPEAAPTPESAPAPADGKAAPPAASPAPQGATAASGPAPSGKSAPSGNSVKSGNNVKTSNSVPSGDTVSSKGRQPTASVAANTQVDHAEPGVADAGSVETAAKAPVAASGGAAQGANPSTDVAQEEDAFLSELRKAMTDDEPLGPRTGQVAGRVADQQAVKASGQAGAAADNNKPRFGRRR